MLAIAEPRTRPKAERFYSSRSGRTCLSASFPALRTGLLSLSPSLLRPPGYGGQAGTSPHRTILALKLTRMGRGWIAVNPTVFLKSNARPAP
jgi:hypothetical protein